MNVCENNTQTRAPEERSKRAPRRHSKSPKQYFNGSSKSPPEDAKNVPKWPQETPGQSNRARSLSYALIREHWHICTKPFLRMGIVSLPANYFFIKVLGMPDIHEEWHRILKPQVQQICETCVDRTGSPGATATNNTWHVGFRTSPRSDSYDKAMTLMLKST